MKLYLSSVGVPDRNALLSLFDGMSSLSVAVIPNGWDVYTADRREPAIQDALRTFETTGFTPKLIDITTLQGEALRLELAEYQMVWVMGGNSFYLHYFVRKSGLDMIVRELTTNGLVYGGESAGAVIAGATLHGVEHLDNPTDAPQIMWDGMGLIPQGIVPHWGADKYADKLEACRAEMSQYASVQTLTNDQALIVHDATVRLVG